MKLDKCTVNEVAQSCIDLYTNLTKTGKPTENEWTVLSCVVLFDVSSRKHEVVSLGTGSKCIGATKMSPAGDTLNDSHAEVFARRGFLLYLYEKLLLNDNTLFRLENGSFRIKKGTEIIFYSSQMPCGDASIIPKTAEVEQFGDIIESKRPTDYDFCETVSKRPKVECDDIHRTGAKCLPHSKQDLKEAGSNYHLLGQVRTKPGRGDRTLSVSCSDKMAKWVHMGIQGSLLDMITKPLYINHFIFGGGVPYSEETLTRALLKRYKCVIASSVPKFYQCDLVFPYVRREANVRPAPGSIVWVNTMNQVQEVAVQGRKLGLTKKKASLPENSLCISKYRLYAKFLEVLDRQKDLKNKIFDDSSSSSIPYNEMKLKSKRYRDKWMDVTQNFFKSWTRKPDIWRFCGNFPLEDQRLVIVDIDDIIRGVPLERALHEKRRRVWQLPTSTLGPSTNSNVPIEGENLRPAIVSPSVSPSMMPGPSTTEGNEQESLCPSSSVPTSISGPFMNSNVTIKEENHGPATVSPSVSSLMPGRSTTEEYEEESLCPSPSVSSLMPGRSTTEEYEEESLCPSPSVFIEYGGSGTACRTSTPSGTPQQLITHLQQRCRRPLQDETIGEQLNYGSEMESDDENDDCDEALFPMLVPRVFREALDTPQDKDTSENINDSSPVSTNTEDEGSGDATSVGNTLMPRDFFHFEWKKIPIPPIPPEERREVFDLDHVGPTFPCQDPYKIFCSIWDLPIMEHIAKETNRYAQEFAAKKLESGNLGPTSRICFWQDTTPDELYCYFAIILAMGIVVKSKLEEYWTVEGDIFTTPGFRAHMYLKRFQLLNTCLHFNSNSDMCVQDLNPSQAKLFKIAPLTQHLNLKFQDMYVLNQNISLDESLLQWKGWLCINQFISNKAASVGIKTYEICESQTGYLWRFEIHAPPKTSPVRQQHQNPLEGVIPATVIRMVKGLENRGRTLWMDNFYNSPALARWLKTQGFDVVGTLRTNRQFVPEELMNLTKTNMRPGQITGLTSGDVDIIVWRDQNRVATISTYHGIATATTSEGKIKPILILDYNIMMGGVDKKDQLLAMYPIERKRTRVWYKKLFCRLLNVSVLNSFIIAKKSASPLTNRDFRINLINSLLSRHTVASSIACQLPDSVFQAKTHHSLEYPLGKAGSRLRRKCVQCKKLTHFYCGGCVKSVCLGLCFASLHS